MSGTGGLAISDVVNVQINMAPLAVPQRNFGILLVAGPSPVIDTAERIRYYATLDEVLGDFSTTSPEYLASDLFFSQSPQPSICAIGRFAQNGSNGILHGAIFAANNQAQLLARLQAITNGTFAISIDGVPQTITNTAAQLIGAAFNTADQATLLATLQGLNNAAFAITVNGTLHQTGGLNMTGITDLAGAATLIDASLPTATCFWDPVVGHFIIQSSTTGVASTITYASAPAAGTDVSGTLRLTAATFAQPPRQGSAGLNFTAITNLNGAASIIQAGISGAGCWWDGTRFHIESLVSGPNSSVSYASMAGTGTDISSICGLTAATGASVPVNGIAAETPLQAAVALRAFPNWYGLTFAVTTPLTDADYIAVAQFIEGANPVSILGYTTQDTACLDPTSTTDLPSQLKAMDVNRTFGQFSSSSPYAVCSMYGRAFTVDFEGSNTVLTMKFKQEPGVTGEVLTESQAAALNAKNCNAFVYYANGAPIIQQGVMAGGYFFDERHNMDYIANRIQNDLFNVLYQSTTKIPQTDAGVHILVTTVTNSLAQGVTNGMLAPGVWNAPGFGQISFGQTLPTGFYVFAPLVASQPQSIREARIAPTIQCALKLAGAIHFANVICSVNR